MTTGRILANSQQAVAALDLGGTKLACGLFAGEGRPLVKRVVPLERRQGKAVAEQVVQEARRLRSSAARRGMVIKAVAVAVPGIGIRERAASGRRTCRVGMTTRSETSSGTHLGSRGEVRRR